MNKFILTTILVLISYFGFSQVTNNFEDGNWLYYYNHCWGIGPNSTYFGTKVTANSQTFNGTKVCRTDNLGQTSVCRLESPWIDLNVGVIKFDHSMPSFNGTRSLKLYLVDQNLVETLIWTYTYTNDNVQNSFVNNTVTGMHKVKWVWNGSGGNSRGELDNISISGNNVSDPSNNCQVYVPPVDTDGDGVPDSQDEYPTDPYRAFNNYYPASDTSTLVFEDLWPSYGDYDLNDLVVGYKFKIVTNSQHNVVEIYNTMIVRAQGAGMENGFGYQFPTVNQSSILDVTGVGDQYGYDIRTNGTENGNSKAVIILFNKSHNVITKWNTVKNDPPSPFKTFNVYIKFSNNGVPASGGWVSLSTLDISKWNPFLVSNGERGREVHLPNYLPTDLVNTSLFGTVNDDTNPSIGKYYKSNTNLPWALDITGHFDYPSEKSDIFQAYIHFVDWVLSNGLNYQDWWSNPNYRNDDMIY